MRGSLELAKAETHELLLVDFRAVAKMVGRPTNALTTARILTEGMKPLKHAQNSAGHSARLQVILIDLSRLYVSSVLDSNISGLNAIAPSHHRL